MEDDRGRAGDVERGGPAAVVGDVDEAVARGDLGGGEARSLGVFFLN